MSSSSSSNNLTDDQRRALYHALLQKSENGKLPKGTMKDLAGKYRVSEKIISRIWPCRKESVQQGAIYADVSSRKKENFGRKKKMDTEQL